LQGTIIGHVCKCESLILESRCLSSRVPHSCGRSRAKEKILLGPWIAYARNKTLNFIEDNTIDRHQFIYTAWLYFATSQKIDACTGWQASAQGLLAGIINRHRSRTSETLQLGTWYMWFGDLDRRIITISGLKWMGV